MIRKNHLLRGDVCKKVVKRDPVTGQTEETKLLDLVFLPGATEVPPEPSNVIPKPEKHFSFSTTLMVLATELYFAKVPDHKLSSYAKFPYQKLVEFVESRKEMTRSSYRHFVEHAYTQFVQHKSFHSAACSKTTTKDVYASGMFDTSTKLEAYTWVTNHGRVARMPTGDARTYQMPDRPLQVDDGEDDDDEDQQVPLLQVVVQQDAAEAPPQADQDEEMEEVEEVEDGGSPQGEEPMNEHIRADAFETGDDPQLPVNPDGKDMEYMIPEDKHLILEGDNNKLVDCTVTWLNMWNKDLQQKILSRLTDENKLSKEEIKKEEVDNDEEEVEVTKEPVIPTPTKMSIEVQTDPLERSEESGSFPKGEVPSSSTGSEKLEEVEKKKPQEDDTAPKKETDPSSHPLQKSLGMKVLQFFET